MMLAYSTISNIGYIVMGLGLASPYGVIGAAVHVFNHALIKATLFLGAGRSSTRRATARSPTCGASDARCRSRPAAISIGAISIVGIPPTAGFLCKWYIALGAIQAKQPFFGFALVFGALFIFIYYIRMVNAFYFQAPTHAEIPDAGEAAVEHARTRAHARGAVPGHGRSRARAAPASSSPPSPGCSSPLGEGRHGSHRTCGPRSLRRSRSRAPGSSSCSGATSFWRRFWSLSAATHQAGVILSMLPGALRGVVYYVDVIEFTPGIGLGFRADALGMFFSLVGATLWLLTTIYAIGYMEDEHSRVRFFGFFALCVSTTVGIAFAVEPAHAVPVLRDADDLHVPARDPRGDARRR